MKNLTLLGIVLLMAMVACNPAKRQCRKADGLLARAVKKCPDLMKPVVQHDTVEVWLPGSASAGEGKYTQVEMDSLVMACSAIVGALQRSAADATDNARAANAKQATANSAVARLRSAVCNLETVTVADKDVLLKIWTENGQIKYWYNVLPRSARAAIVTTIPQVAMTGDCPPCEGVASWYRVGFWILLVILIGLIVIAYYLFSAPFERGQPY